MEPINIICGIVLVCFGLVFFAVHKETKRVNAKWKAHCLGVAPTIEKEIVKVTNDLIDNSIFDMFPSWKDEFNDDDQMREIECSCDLYLASVNLLKDPRNLMLILQLSDATAKYEKYVLK